MKTYKINYIFKNLSIKNRYPKTELIYSNHFTFLVSVILSAQSTDVAVNKATKKLFRIAKNPEQFINLGEKKLKQYIKSIGLFNSKAKNIIKLSKILKEQYNSKVPSRFEELINLPGVGNKTASVFQNVILNEPRIAVDTHVFRVSNRIGLVEENTPDKTQLALEKTVPKNWKMSAHHLLIFHGRYICKSQKPLCKDCYIKSFCEYKNKNL